MRKSESEGEGEGERARVRERERESVTCMMSTPPFFAPAARDIAQSDAFAVPSPGSHNAPSTHRKYPY